MADILNRYVDPAFAYQFTQGPHVVRTVDDALEAGINCVSLAHLVLQDLFGGQLPPELQCAEMYLDRSRFAKVSGLELLRRGDLVWLGVQDADIEPEAFVPVYDASGQLTNWTEFPIKHVAIYTGNNDKHGDPLLLHSTHIEGTNVIWPLRQFSDHRRHQKLHGITRLLAAQTVEVHQLPEELLIK